MRSLEDHLSPQELISLPESREILAHGGDEQQRLLQHLESCDSCGALANVRWTVKGLAGSTMASEENCPETDAWLEFAAGLRQDDSAEMLRHAARCGRCAADLKEALELMLPSQVDNAPAPSGNPVEGLASNSSEWQSVMATRMAAGASAINHGLPHAVSVSKAQRRWPKLSVWLAIPVATALAAIAILGLWRWVHPSDAHLLALAYNKQRILVLRIPGALPVPMASGTRGSTNGLAEPSELLELRLRTQKHLDQTPNSPYWHQILGEINLLEGDGESARRNLEIAQSSDDKLPNLKNDLAAAWFELGDRTGNAEDYARAAELYSQQLRDPGPDLSLLYFNRAICWERQNLTQPAVDDLRTALSLESSAVWRRAIQDELTRLSAHSTVPTDGYEEALSRATEGLIPQWGRSPDVRKSIKTIAEMGLRHHDHWLLDWIAATHNVTAQMADRHLAMAATAASTGQGLLALAESHQAIALYQKAGETPGRARAQLIEIYALQRLARSYDCLRRARVLAADQSLIRYAWIRTELSIDEGNCNSFLGNFEAEQSAFEQALWLSRAMDLPVLNTRALGAEASLLTFRGATSAAWDLDVSGLRRCEKIQCPPIHLYKFLYNMVTAAEDLRLVNVAAEIMRNAEQAAAASGDQTAHEYSLETLAKLMGRAGAFSASDRAFSEAWDLARRDVSAPLAGLYQAEWQTDRAEILRREGKIAASMALLHQSASQILASNYQIERVNYYTELSIADRLTGSSNGALADAQNAVHESEKSLPTLATPIDRAQWSNEHLDSYSALVRVYLQRGDMTSALASWERFRSAPYAQSNTLLRWRSAARESDLANDYVVVIARVDDSYVGWLAHPQPLRAVKQVVLGDFHLSRSATTFYQLCADRYSSLDDVSSLGARLYSQLLSPLIGQLSDTDRLWIDLDPTLATLPLAALRTASGMWLGKTARITVLPPWWSITPGASLAESPVPLSSHFVVINGFRTTADRGPRQEYSEATEIAHIFPQSMVLDTTASSSHSFLSSLAAADVFHFSGHAGAGSLILSDDKMPSAPATLGPEFFSSVQLTRWRLAVLAACNTSSADPDEYEVSPNLRTAMLLSGARTVIASSWDVDDKSTQALMLAFYTNLKSGISVAGSLQSAQEAVRSHRSSQHPWFWASFQTYTR
jgi:CHAT domain-containing protein